MIGNNQFSEYAHGLSNTKDYRKWAAIKKRCYNKNNKDYIHYGGRGILMWDKWVDDPKSFIEYIKKLDNYNGDNVTLDRIDNNKGYIPNNIRWVSMFTQNTNKRKQKSNKTGIIGVCKHTCGKYQCNITHFKKNIYLGLYTTIEEALNIRNNYIIKNNLPHKIQKISYE